MTAPGGMQEGSRLMWRAVRDAAPAGLLFDDLVRISGVAASRVDYRLKFLVSRNYLRIEPARGNSRWFLGTQVPRGESAERFAGLDGDAAGALPHQAAAPRGVPRGVPNSVFALGDLVAGATSAAAGAATAAVQLPLQAAVGVANAATQTLQAAAQVGGGAQHDLSSWRHPEGVELLTTAGPYIPKPTIQSSTTAEPKFELHSDNVLVIDPAGDGTDPIALQPTVTRALFRWLDRLGGTSLHRMTEDAAE